MHTPAAEHCAGAVDHEGQSSLLNVNFRLSRFQCSSYLPTNTCAHCTKVRLRISPICDAPLSRSARRGAASPRYRNLAEITVLTVWFSSPRKSYPMTVKITLGLISTVAYFFREKASKIDVRKWNIGNVGKATRKRKSWARFNFYVFAWPSLFYLRTEKLRDSGNPRRLFGYAR